ncbi:unnamed protein product [Ectocarpus sp. 6 AP-2014]
MMPNQIELAMPSFPWFCPFVTPDFRERYQLLGGQQQCRYRGGHLGYSDYGGLISFLVGPDLRVVP